MNLLYAERYGDQDEGEEYIAEKGIFMSVAEFVPYRKDGWSGTDELNAAADAIIAGGREAPSQGIVKIRTKEAER